MAENNCFPKAKLYPRQTSPRQHCPYVCIEHPCFYELLPRLDKIRCGLNLPGMRTIVTNWSFSFGSYCADQSGRHQEVVLLYYLDVDTRIVGNQDQRMISTHCNLRRLIRRSIYPLVFPLYGKHAHYISTPRNGFYVGTEPFMNDNEPQCQILVCPLNDAPRR
ncbi:hypothetical protein B0H34DRAFT_54889 [Crassisporium funariophilum]|nr:hypothetical protein B0H34DRAFT_54889 [Crassisporium funariophilum]